VGGVKKIDFQKPASAHRAMTNASRIRQTVKRGI